MGILYNGATALWSYALTCAALTTPDSVEIHIGERARKSQTRFQFSFFCLYVYSFFVFSDSQRRDSDPRSCLQAFRGIFFSKYSFFVILFFETCFETSSSFRDILILKFQLYSLFRAIMIERISCQRFYFRICLV